MPPWLCSNGPHCDIVISSRIRLARNLAHHQFPRRASLYERTAIFNEVAEAFSRANLENSFNVVNFGALENSQREFMVEERLASPDLAAMDGDRGIIHDNARQISIMVNEEDHIRIQCLDSGLRPMELWAQTDGIDDALGMQIDYAFDKKLGFLTCCPTNAGTGLRVSFLVHLPACVLTRTIDGVLCGAGQMGVSTRGFFGEHSAISGSLFQLSNSAALGSTESAFCGSTCAVVESIIDHERKAREKLLAHARIELTDKIFRAYGILCNASILGLDEFLNLTSALRLGIECTLFDKCTIQDLNRLLLFVLPAHMRACMKKEIADPDVREERAALVRLFFAKYKKQGGA